MKIILTTAMYSMQLDLITLLGSLNWRKTYFG